MKKSRLVFSIICSAMFLRGCGDLSISRGDASPGVRDLLVASATIDSALVVSSGELILDTTGSVDIGCTLAGSDGASTAAATGGTTSNAFATALAHKSVFFTVPSGESWTVNAIKPRIRKNADATLAMEIQTVSGSEPSGTSVVSGSHNTTLGSYGDANGDVQTVSVASTVLASGDYSIVMRNFPFTDLGLNYISWVLTNNSSGCTSFPIAQASGDGGTTWSADGSSRRRMFELEVETHETAGVASWIVSGYQNANWDLSTLTFTENSSGYTGTITYDVGAGDDFTTPAYSLLAKTLSEIQAASDLTGQYFFIKANFSVDAPGYDNASLSDGSIEAN